MHTHGTVIIVTRRRKIGFGLGLYILNFSYIFLLYTFVCVGVKDIPQSLDVS